MKTNMSSRRVLYPLLRPLLAVDVRKACASSIASNSIHKERSDTFMSLPLKTVRMILYLSIVTIPLR